ncbi:hypothetical protein VSX64_12745 [Aurantimonas sp. C2-6-R+9]|uniref:hypothetical protein n=1 Tax=unclassified Aurantimonas TaxID=2638230 RepID=UPI002E16E9A2|nr:MULTISPECIES: hypothetical protein [unclassified Aurantimonas]MEC5291475.1 hypothetical protein [Aurantimonas sp. C2-3-R2]MEC5381739.1 hypothetical protein [Aurantimonas sp. C2-6-R+9]MEC5412562.1 hypothetical protein [Aurantimonas sp. C2-4-R8]
MIGRENSEQGDSGRHQRNDGERTRDERSSEAPSGAAVAAGESQPDAQAERTPRRRGRPRRSREGDEAIPASETRPGDEAATVEARTVEAAVNPDHGVKAPETEGEAPVKRRPGRPRKKKPEEASAETRDGEGNTLPDFLLASNG